MTNRIPGICGTTCFKDNSGKPKNADKYDGAQQGVQEEVETLKQDFMGNVYSS